MRQCCCRSIRITVVFAMAAGAAFGQSFAPSFTKDIAPMLAEKCVECHGQTSTMSDLDLRSDESLRKGGQHGPVIVPGNSGESLLYKRLTGQLRPQMPFGGRLTDQQIATIKAWIDGGAKWDPAVTTLKSTAPAQKQFTER